MYAFDLHLSQIYEPIVNLTCVQLCQPYHAKGAQMKYHLSLENIRNNSKHQKTSPKKIPTTEITMTNI